MYGMLEEVTEFKEYLHGPRDAGAKPKVKFRTGDIGLREIRRRFRRVDDESRCECGSECEVLAECPLYKKEREMYMVEAWNNQEKTVAVRGHRKWVEKEGSE